MRQANPLRLAQRGECAHRGVLRRDEDAVEDGDGRLPFIQRAIERRHTVVRATRQFADDRIRASVSRIRSPATVTRPSANASRPDVIWDWGFGIGRDLSASGTHFSADAARTSVRAIGPDVIRDWGPEIR